MLAIMLYRCAIFRNQKKIVPGQRSADSFWIYANNPTTARIHAIRWFDMFIGNRNYSREVGVNRYFDSHPAMRTEPIIYQYICWHKLRRYGKLIASFSYGRNAKEAREIAEKYFPPSYKDEYLRSTFCKIERVKGEI